MRLPIVVLLVVRTAAADPGPSTTPLIDIAAVWGTTCALHEDHTVSCWGSNRNHILGLPDTTAIRSTPIRVPQLDGALELEDVWFGICGRFADGTVKCMGMDEHSKAVAALQPLKDVASLNGHCARLTTSEVWCFDSTRWSKVPGLTDARSVYGYGAGGCAIHADGTVSCWQPPGTARLPELVGAAADGSMKKIAGVANAVEISRGLYHACARLRDGRVTCWGSNTSGELGRNVVDSRSAVFNAPGYVSGVGDATGILAGPGYTCIRRRTGTLACTGSAPWYASNSGTGRLLDVKVSNVRLLASGDQTCVAGNKRDVWCWGDGRQGQLGNGLALVLHPAREIAGITDATAVFVNALGTCIARRAGAVECRGSHNMGNVTLRSIHSLSIHRSYLTGLDAQGRLWVNGEAQPRSLRGTAHAGACVLAAGAVTCNAGIFGPGPRGPQLRKHPAITDGVELAGTWRMCVRRKLGTVACFRVEQMLSGSDTLDEIPNLTDAIAVSVGERNACAVRSDGTVWCWKNTDSPAAPTKVAGISDAIAVGVGFPVKEDEEAACAVKKDGTVACWGSNDHGQLGVTGIAKSQTPVTVTGVKDAVSVHVGWHHACARTKRNTVACWGSTEYGQSGTQQTDRIATPQRVVWP